MAFQISINQLAEFGRGTDAAKRTIVAQQIVPNSFKTSHYQLAKGCIRRFFQRQYDLAPIKEGIIELKARTFENPKKLIDRNTSIEALERFVKLSLPATLRKLKIEVIKAPTNSVSIDGIEIIVAPEIILKGKLDGKDVIGAVKIRISKGKPFGMNEAQEVAFVIYKYLKKNIKRSEGKVMPELCFCLDVFSDRLTSASGVSKRIILKVKTLCKEIRTYWNKVVTIELTRPSEDSTELKSIVSLSINRPNLDSLETSRSIELQFWPGKFAEANHWLRQAKMNFRVL